MHEFERAFKWLEFLHNTMKAASQNDAGFQSEYTQAYLSGMKAAVNQYGEEIEKIRHMLNGYMVEDVDLSGGEKHVS